MKNGTTSVPKSVCRWSVDKESYISLFLLATVRVCLCFFAGIFCLNLSSMFEFLQFKCLLTRFTMLKGKGLFVPLLTCLLYKCMLYEFTLPFVHALYTIISAFLLCYHYCVVKSRKYSWMSFELISK